MAKRKGTKEQTIIYKTLHRKVKIELHEPHLKPEVNSGVSEGLEVPAPHVTPIVLLLNDTSIIWYGNLDEQLYVNKKNNWYS